MHTRDATCVLRSSVPTRTTQYASQVPIASIFGMWLPSIIVIFTLRGPGSSIPYVSTGHRLANATRTPHVSTRHCLLNACSIYRTSVPGID
eukprot:1272055-Rhodomonas_salina.2